MKVDKVVGYIIKPEHDAHFIGVARIDPQVYRACRNRDKISYDFSAACSVTRKLREAKVLDIWCTPVIASVIEVEFYVHIYKDGTKSRFFDSASEAADCHTDKVIETIQYKKTIQLNEIK